MAIDMENRKQIDDVSFIFVGAILVRFAYKQRQPV